MLQHFRFCPGVAVCFVCLLAADTMSHPNSLSEVRVPVCCTVSNKVKCHLVSPPVVQDGHD